MGLGHIAYDRGRIETTSPKRKAIPVIKTTLAVLSLAVAALAAGNADAASFATVPRILQKKLPSLNVPTHPQFPRICVNPIDKGPGARKCG